MAETTSTPTAHNLTVTDLRTEYLRDTLGIDVSQPRLSWVLQSSTRGVRQSAYQILVAGSREALENDEGDMWNSGKVESRQSVNVVYAGDTLQGGTTYYWKVRVWNQNDEVSSWSSVATFHMGLLAEDAWQGQWIGAPDTEVTAPLLRREFTVEQGIEAAHVYIAGLGYYELYINGQKVGDHVLDPGTTQYDKRILYVTYDVADYLQPGANTVGVMLGKGWFWQRNYRQYGAGPQLLLQLNLALDDDTTLSIVSDETWKVSAGPITSHSIYAGEVYDARREQPGWNAPGYDDAGWDSAEIVASPGGQLDAHLMPPIRVTQTLRPVQMTQLEDGAYVFDFGQNLTGWPRLCVSGGEGTQVVLKTAEVTRKDTARIQGENPENFEARLDTRNNQAAEAADTYICRGAPGTEVYEPRFTYHGFRYVQVEGYPGEPTLKDLEARVVHTDVKPVGEFHCSNSLLNQTHTNILWSQVGNLHSIPTDCPQRDERQGWTGDAHLSVEEAMHNFDMAAFYAKWLQDVQDAQSEDGSIPDVVPHHGRYPEVGTPAWQVAYPLVLWYMYEYYDDVRILEHHYDSLKQWITYMDSIAKDYIIETGRGDWCPPQRTEPIDGSVPITSTGHYHQAADIMAKIAGLLGKSDDAVQYAALADDIKAAFNDRFLDKTTNNYGAGSQTSNAYPLYLGLVPEENQASVVSNLVHNIMEQHAGHLWTGILGTKAVVSVLPAMGLSDVLYNAATQVTYPSYGHMLARGATTVWERWGAFRYFDPAGMNSLNHIMFGTIDEFFYKNLAGIQLASPAYGQITIKPHVVGDLTHARAAVDTIRGRVASSWQRVGNTFTLEVTLPANSRGKVSVPKLGLTDVTVEEGDKVVWQTGAFVSGVNGISNAEDNGDYVTFAVASGSYTFKLHG